jgi:hypothetical protein
MIFSCEQPTDEMKAFMTKTSRDCRAGCDSATMPFYTMQNNKGIQCGSGVLLQVGEKHFIVTAAHTFDILTKADLGVGITNGVINDKLIELNNITVRTSQTTDPIDREDDPFDIAVLELPGDVGVEVSRGKRFLHLNELDPFDRQDPRSWYMVFGYPTAWNPSDDEGKRVHSTACSLNTFLYCGERGKLPRECPVTEILMDFKKEHCIPDKEGDPDPPNPNGMSGCGIWRLAHAGIETTRWKPGDARLVGIEHTWNKDFHVLRGTRISCALQLIYRHHKDLRPAFEFHYGPRARLL